MDEPKYQFLIKKCEYIGIKHLNDAKAFIKYSAFMDDAYNNINDYNPNRNPNRNFDCVWWYDCWYYDQ